MKQAVLCASFAILTSSLDAQTTQGLITGQITDLNGNPIANAQVACENVETSAHADGRSGASGLFALPLLPPGRYRVRVGANGYQRQEINELELPVAAYLDIPFRLRLLEDVWESRQYQNLVLPGQNTLLKFYGPDLDLSRTVNVGGTQFTAGALESTVSRVMSPLSIRDLPLSGRDVYTTLALQANVASDTTTARGIGISVGGQRPSSSHFLLDGLENNNQLITGPLAIIPPETVQEFRISTNNFSAEYGWTTGYLANAVTKSGTNAWHGLGYFNLKNEVLNANDFSRNAASQPRNPQKEVQAGMQIGGPLWRDRLYQSASIEYLHGGSRDEALHFYVPSPLFLDQLKNFPQSNQARILLTRFGVPSLPGQPDRFDTNLKAVAVAPPIEVKRTTALERLDYVTRRGGNRVMGRTSVSRWSRPDFTWSPYPDFSGGLAQNATGLGLSLHSNLSPALTNEARGGLSFDLIEFNRPHPELPTLNVNGPNGPVILPGSLAAYSYRNRSRTFELNDNLTWFRGRHTFKFGGGVLLRKLDGYLTFAQAGQYVFGPFALFTADLPDIAYVGMSREKFEQARLPVSPDYDREYRTAQFHAFAQDSVRLKPRLTINYGFRLERAGVPINTGAAKDALVQLGAGNSLAEALTQAKVVYPGGGDQPLYTAKRFSYGGRFGVSYSPAKDTVVRAAFGVFHDRPFDNLWQNLRNNNVELGVFVPEQPVAYLDPVDKVLQAMPKGIADANSSRLTLYQPEIRSPRASIYFAGFEQRLGNLAVEANASGAYGRSLITTDTVNRSYSRPGILDPFASRLQPDLQQIYYRANQGISSYNALSALARYQGRRSLWQVSYTWSHSIDNQSEPLFGDYFDLSFTKSSSAARRPTSTFVRQFDSAADRGNSDFDQRHNLVFYGLWESPSTLAGRRLPAVMRGWKLGAIGAIRSGLPFTVTAASAPGSPLLSNRASLVVPASEARIDSPAGGGRILLQASAFRSGGFAIGNTGRNAFSGPGLYNVDLSVSRGFALSWLGEAGRLTVRADAYNALNHANLGNPDAFLGSPTFGLAAYGRQETGNGFPAVAPLRETARQVQLLFRLEF